MVWEPFAIAIAFGLLVSAALYFMLLWPGREPPDEDADAPDRMPHPAPVADESRPGKGIA